MPPSLDVIVVNWNAGGQLRAALDSIRDAERGALDLQRVVVVDNASTDGSLSGLDQTGLPLTIVANRRNLGFGAACNQGAAGSRADYLLFLNPDARAGRRSLAAAVGFLEREENRGYGVLGLRLLDDAGRVWRHACRLPTPATFWIELLGLDRLLPRVFPGKVMREWDHADSRPVEHVIGAFYLVRRSLFEALGGFDRRYFVYLEDLDFSCRAKAAGHGVYYLATAEAWHRGGGTSEAARGRRLYYALSSRMTYGDIHFGRLAALGLRLGTLVVEPWTRLALAAAEGSGARLRETVEAYRELWREALGIGRGAGA